jgi:HK97 family phage prohead protease
MDNKSFKLELKSLTPQGTFTGLASVFGNVDLGGDTVDSGAFARSLSHRGGDVPILFAHDQKQPVGLGKVRETGLGLEINGELVMETAKAQEVFALMKKGVLKGLSIGYDIVRNVVKDGINHLQELKLYEVSIVTFPMNELATVSSVKAQTDPDAELQSFLETVKACTLIIGGNR